MLLACVREPGVAASGGSCSLGREVMLTFWVVIAVVAVIGALLFKRAVDRTPDLTPEQVADLIERYINNPDDLVFEWDDYTHIPSRNPALEQIRRECEEVCERFPPRNEGEWYSPEAKPELKRLAQRARGTAQPAASGNSRPAAQSDGL